ncbi:hypothetical protein BMH30_13665 [Leucobacter sp. OLES1]|nr:hypothetical protein BMH30_13665 [Leucobacter sp. OLES1]
MSRLRPIQAVAGFAAIATATAAGCALLAGAVARRVVTPEARPDSSTRVRSVLPAARASRRYGVDGPVVRIRGGWSELPGSYSLILDGGATHAKVGPVLEARRGTAAREILTTDRGRVRRGATGRVMRTQVWPDLKGTRVSSTVDTNLLLAEPFRDGGQKA